jgi:multicomponent Na+:H+ antiporter subunit E
MSRRADAATAMSLPRRAAVRTGRVLRFVLWFGWQFLRSNAAVAWEILTPGQQLEPAVVELELRCRTPLEIALMAGLVTLTPGTLALSTREDPPRMAVHGMHAGDVDAFRAQLRELEDRMLAALRPVGEGHPAGAASEGR